jgi:hypothetical protein
MSIIRVIKSRRMRWVGHIAHARLFIYLLTIYFKTLSVAHSAHIVE